MGERMEMNKEMWTTLSEQFYDIRDESQTKWKECDMQDEQRMQTGELTHHIGTVCEPHTSEFVDNTTMKHNDVERKDNREKYVDAGK